MLQHAGSLPAAPNVWLDGNVQDTRYEFILTDGRTGAKRYVYAYRWNGTPTDLDTTDYVAYTQGGPSPSGCTPGPESCGRIESIAVAHLPVPSHTYNTHFGHNWATDAFEIKSTDGPANPDILYRLEYCEGVGGGGVFSETEDTWANPCPGENPPCEPIWLAVKDKTIRIIRGVQGAASGPHTTKYEFAYPTMLVTRVNLRVHPIPNVNGRADHEAAIVTERPSHNAYVWQETAKAESGTFLDRIDHQCNGYPLNLNDEKYLDDWTEVASELRST